MRPVGMLQNADPFRVADQIRKADTNAIGVEDKLRPVGVKTSVAIQVEIKTKLGRAVCEVRDHKDRRPRVVKQVNLVLADIRVPVERLAIAGINITDVGQAGQTGPESIWVDEIRRDQEIVSEQIALRRDARDDFGKRPRLA